MLPRSSLAAEPFPQGENSVLRWQIRLEIHRIVKNAQHFHGVVFRIAHGTENQEMAALMLTPGNVKSLQTLSDVTSIADARQVWAYGERFQGFH